MKIWFLIFFSFFRERDEKSGTKVENANQKAKTQYSGTLEYKGQYVRTTVTKWITQTKVRVPINIAPAETEL